MKSVVRYRYSFRGKVITPNRRWLATTASNTEVFDRSLKQRHRAFTLNNLHDAKYYDYLREESARRLVDRLDDITKSFPTAVEIGSYRGSIYEMIAQSKLDTISGDNPHIKGSIGGIENLIQCDMVPMDMSNATHLHQYQETLPFQRIVCDEEFLPFPENSVDLVISNMSLHWTNDIPQAFQNIYNILRPDGAFICSILGGNTLQELRHCFYLAELERRGGMSPHASPLTLPSDIAGLMQAAKFALPTIDVDTIQVSPYSDYRCILCGNTNILLQVTYPDAFTLMEHIFKMGEGTAALNRQYAVGRDTFLAMASIYQGAVPLFLTCKVTTYNDYLL
jgi:NADH dehydrogenase [ubiquinone] 1 alpha subcomplex assembly factor 5